MKISIRLKVIIGYIIFGIVGFIIISSFTYKNALERTTKSRAEALYKEATSISQSYATEYYGNTLTAQDMKRILTSLSNYIDGEIWLVSSAGKITLSTDTSRVGTTLDQFDVTDFGSHNYVIGDFYDTFSGDYLSVYAPVTTDYTVRGFVLIHLPMSAVESDALNLLNTAYLTYLFLMLILLGCMLLIQFTWIRKMEKVKNHLKDYHNGNVTSPINYPAVDELGDISAYISYMEHRLGSLEEDQRNFISNISHDFRSPLTSLKGYIEAMLDGTIPPEMYDKYLKIVLSEAQRLSKLSESLLELNKTGSKGALLDITDFDIHQMIRSALMTFEGQCKEREIHFKLSLTGQTLFVSADMSKIQQILYNLIDNAIKFSFDQSDINIETSIKGGKVFVSVKDHGAGIAKEDLPKIWDRFYKSDASRGKDKKGSGIGLSIVKGIIQAHGENINVVSTVDAGTEFIFTLPLAEREKL